MGSEMCIRDSDYIVLVNKDVSEYGWKSFGDDGYGQSIMNWINDNYEVIEVFGESFSSPLSPGATILKRH